MISGRFISAMNLLKGFRRYIPRFRPASGTLTRVSLPKYHATGILAAPASMKLEEETKLEEENWPWYTTESFYPVRIGDVLHDKYRVLYKLGYGTTATIGCAGISSQFLCSSFFILKLA